jgi:hypothetical protein
MSTRTQGHYCSDKTVAPLPCPVNEYNDLFQQIKCRKCKTAWPTIAEGSRKCITDMSSSDSMVAYREREDESNTYELTSFKNRISVCSIIIIDKYNFMKERN